MSISSVNGVASTVSRYRFVAAGGETSLTGSDANGATLSYLVGKEEVYLNGALLVRGQDYTGTDGATISSLTALVAGDTVEIITFVPFAIPTAISSATVTTQGDLIVATGASAVTRLGVGSSGQILTSNGTTPAYTSTVTGTLNNGTLTGTLTAASSAGTSGQLLSSTGTGVEWVAAPAAGSMTLLSTTTLSGASTTISGINQGYTHLYMYIYGVTNASSTGFFYAYPNATSNITSTFGMNSSSAVSNSQNSRIWLSSLSANISDDPDNANNGNSWSMNIYNYSNTSGYKPYSVLGGYFNGNGNYQGFSVAGFIETNSGISSLVFYRSGGNFSTGTVLVYGVN